MFNTSTAAQPSAVGNSPGLFGNSNGPLQSTPTAPNLNAEHTNTVPTLFSSIQNANPNGGGLFGSKLMSPTPNSNTSTLFGKSNFTGAPSTLSGHTLTNNTYNQMPQQQGIGAYGVQVNPLTISLTNDIPPSLLGSQTSTNARRSGNSSLLNSFKTVPQKSSLLLQKKPLALQSDELKNLKGLVNKPNAENISMRKLTIDKEKINSLKKILFEQQQSPIKETANIIDDAHKLETKKPHSVTVEVEEDEENHIAPTSDDVKPDANGYWCLPNIDTLTHFSDEQLSNVEFFIVGRENYGSIHFLEPVDLTHLTKPSLKENLFGRIVHFYESEPVVEVYPEDFETIKPCVGQGLNVRAVINLQNIEPDTDLEKFVEKLNSFPDNEFISYDPFLKNWCFKVRHFSKYGLLNETIDGRREIHCGRVVKNISSASKRIGLNTVDIPGFLNNLNEADFEVVEEKENDLTTHAVEIVSVQAKKQFLQNENIIREMAYEPNNVDIDDLKELINENYLNSFKESKDLIEEMQIANALGSGSIFNKCKLKEKINLLDAEQQSFYENKAKLGQQKAAERSQSLESDAKNNKNGYILSTEGLKLLKILESSCDKAVNNEKLPFILNINFGFHMLKIPDSIWEFFSLLFDTEEQYGFNKATEFTNFLNKVLKYKLSQKNSEKQNDDVYYNIFEKLCYRDIYGAIQLSYQTSNPQLSAILSLLSSNSKDFNSELNNLAKLQLESLENDDSCNQSLILIYKVLANDITLLNNPIVDNWLCKLLALLNYSSFASSNFTSTLKEFFNPLNVPLGERDVHFKIISLYVNGNAQANCMDITGDLFIDFVIHAVLNYNYGYKFNLDDSLVDLVETGSFDSVYNNLFLALFLQSDETKTKCLNYVLKSNINLALDEVSTLQDILLISDDIIYTIQGDYYGKKGKKLKEINAYLKTRNNEKLIEKLLLEKTGPYLIFISKENVLLDIINNMPEIDQSTHILKLYAQFKKADNRDLKILNELVEKIDLFRSSNAEIKNFLYKFVVEQFIIHFTSKNTELNISLLNKVKNLETDDKITNIYLKRVVKSLNL